MKVSVELTLTPLQNDFEGPIIDFIKRLRRSKFTVLENLLSTQVYGSYREVMPFLQDEIGKTFETLDHVLINIKVVKSDRSDYEPDF
ncbi:hypothetical protein ACFQ1M_14925 [Sungkyunkwania multivorans]|uniref:Thiamine-binding protein domain-containing protein n=1 Tax=Sungkyunkwania multivorans TaxID=1173618 RepID=A0ABW3D335_9FLAO